MRYRNEPYTPTIARMMPTKIKRRDSFSVTNASQNEAKLTYIRLNRQTPCPPRGAVPVNQGRCMRLFHSQRPARFRSWRRPSRLCQAWCNRVPPGRQFKIELARQDVRCTQRQAACSAPTRISATVTTQRTIC